MVLACRAFAFGKGQCVRFGFLKFRHLEINKKWWRKETGRNDKNLIRPPLIYQRPHITGTNTVGSITAGTLKGGEKYQL